MRLTRPKLTTLRHNGDFRIVFTYEDGLVVELDFGDHLAGRSGPVIEPLQDERFFAQAFIDHGVITTEHVSEAIQYRTFDRTLWV